MMKACAKSRGPFGIPTVVSLNSIMVDGTGMCGSCRVTVGGKMKFACVDGADFDGHLVNFDELQLRQKRFAREEKAAHGALPQRVAPSWPASRSRRSDRPNAWRPPASLPEPQPETPGPRLPEEHQDHSARARAHAAPAAGSARPQLQRGRARPGSRRRVPRGRALPALQEAALRSGLSGGHRYPGLHLRAGTQGCASVLPDSEESPTRCPRSAAASARRNRSARPRAWSALKFKPVAIGRLERFVADCRHGPRMGRGRRRRCARRNQARGDHRQRARRAWPAPANWRATA